jgi:hypothetical protein
VITLLQRLLMALRDTYALGFWLVLNIYYGNEIGEFSYQYVDIHLPCVGISLNSAAIKFSSKAESCWKRGLNKVMSIHSPWCFHFQN